MSNLEGLAVTSGLLKNTEHLDEIYKSLIHESYIQPIRTLVAVDDEFPTVDDLIEVLESKSTHSEKDFDFFSKFKDVDVQRVKDIIQYARNTERGWLVDIQDGSTIKNRKNEKWRIQTRSATPVDSVNEGGVLRAVDQQFSVHSQR